jgi:exopolyphosphatase / guanosine-5'-triphosphate,3'-diphosphate pyrophosphatase
MLLAAIDIGSNAVRLFFSNVFEQDGKIIVEKASLMRIPIRLGDDVFTTHVISESKKHKLIKTLKAFKLLIEVNEPVAYRACATSAMREAHNSHEVVEQIARETGIKVKIISGLEEAHIVSSVQNHELMRQHPYSLFIDVGGGSTEISLLTRNEILESESFEIGTVRMLSQRVQKLEWIRMRQWLLQFNNYFKDMAMVGAGGNINKISRLYGHTSEKTLPFENLQFALKTLQKYSLQERIEILGLRPDRADVIVPAAQIFNFIMKTTQTKTLLVPKIGLSDGIVNVLYREMKYPAPANKV